MMALINFILCSGLLLLAYRVFLQNERMYRFNRFYLLFSLLFSAAVPFITITTHPQSLPVSYQHAVERVFTSSQTTATSSPLAQHPQILPDVDPNPVITAISIILAVYAFVTLVLLGRFMINLYRINRSITQNQRIELDDTQLVLTDASVIPHSFLNYVFVNRDDYPDGLEPQIICHEQAHVRQRHSLDVLLVEMMQVLCWFNPFIPFYRRAIQLNHEFLADEAVISQSIYDTIDYQYLLLAKASQANSIHLASQFNYQTTKKRLTMMTKNTTFAKAIGKQLLMLPVAALAVLLFSEKTAATVLPKIFPTLKTVEALTAKVDTPKVDFVRFAIPKAMRTKYSATDASEKVMSEYTAILKKYDIPDGNGKTTDISATDKAQLHALFIQMSVKQQNRQQFRFTKAFKPVAKNTITTEQLSEWQQDPKKFGVWVNDKRVKNADLANYKADDFDNLMFSRLTPVAIKNDGFRFQVNLMTKPYYAEYYKKTMANQEDRMDYWHIQRRK
ncbi:M56 family metallopeptidase [Mucilaginibacter mali]|uniref:M56 family metallopeptidase n=1 Tax=Mucilaginibacter mali TaxID=2740462 RepID=A0A7D4TKQ8_9SPHI|nr:M56 family metallopeptidase [Mucilaginibacter mali]QKJ28913.1 M56 family metallopeptidase [Mucilaginibacter mali]